MVLKNVTIALDGPAASGKGTLGRLLSEKYDLAYFDTGKLYRGVGYQLIQDGGNPDDENDVLRATDKFVKNFSLSILQNPNLKNDDAGNAASKVGKFGAMREKIIDLQRDFASDPGQFDANLVGKGAILDGRDIGTVVCPNADAKLYVIASIEKRAERRLKELQNLGQKVTYNDILADMQERDERDSSRKAAPMLPAGDAHILDTSDWTPDQVLEQAVSFIQKKLGISD